jgi:molybdopterin synthase catalytic subunit
VLDEIAREALSGHAILDALIVHRVGEIGHGEVIVLCAAWAEHRAAAFAACRQLIEALKSRAPFWKKERLTDGERWVTHNTPG